MKEDISDVSIRLCECINFDSWYKEYQSNDLRNFTNFVLVYVLKIMFFDLVTLNFDLAIERVQDVLQISDAQFRLICDSKFQDNSKVWFRFQPKIRPVGKLGAVRITGIMLSRLRKHYSSYSHCP